MECLYVCYTPVAVSVPRGQGQREGAEVCGTTYVCGLKSYRCEVCGSGLVVFVSLSYVMAAVVPTVRG